MVREFPSGFLGDVRVLLVLSLAGHALGQCRPALYELGGAPGPLCAATFGGQVNYEAVARGRFISIESCPLFGGSPAVFGRVELDHPVQVLATEITGRVWASDGLTIYALDTSAPSAPQVIGRLAISTQFFISHLRVRGSYVYASNANAMFIIDATNPAAPVLRSTFYAGVPAVNDLEVVGSYAYLAIDEGSVPNHSLMVVDISDPVHPIEIGEAGNGGRQGLALSKAPNLSGLYMLSASPTSAAVEVWNIANPLFPSVQAANATLDPASTFPGDELRATNTSICYLQRQAPSLKQFDTSSLAQIAATPFASNEAISRLGVDPPFAFVTRSSGELARVTLGSSPAPIDPYFDVSPGYTRKVAAQGEGFSVVSGLNDLWFFATPSGSAPYAFAHVKPDAGYTFDSGIALLEGGTLFASESTASSTLFLAYHVVGGSSPGVFWQGSYDVGDIVRGFDAGVDASDVPRVYYTVGGLGGGPATLHVLNASNLGAISHTGSIVLTSGVSSPVRFLPSGSFPVTPARVAVGGFAGATQLISVASAGSPSSLGVIPSSSQAIAPGLPPTLWLVDENHLKAYNIGTPAAPVLQSSTLLSSSLGNVFGLDLKAAGAFGGLLCVTTSEGDLIEVVGSNPTSPFINQIAHVSSRIFGADGEGLAFDGIQLHLANGVDGYAIVSLNLSAPPREDPNFPLRGLGPQGVIAICPGTPLVIPAHFVASPAASAFRWLRFNPAIQQYVPLADGPTGTGSTVSGATTATLTIGTPGAADVGIFACQASNSCGMTQTDTSVEARLSGYANCDRSTTPPVLNVNDFVCFLTAFAQGVPDSVFQVANCDGSTLVPVLNVNDFVCFQQRFAQGCP